MTRRSRALAIGLTLAILGACSEEAPQSPVTPPPPPPDPTASSSALLSGLVISAGTLTPPFAPNVTDYAITASHTTGTMTVTPSATDGSPSIEVEGPGLPAGGTAVASGSPSPQITLDTGANDVTVTSVSEDGSSTMVYRITVRRSSAPKACTTNVDRGSPTDGITTITVVQPPGPCTVGGRWTGWDCTVLDSDANNNGVTYRVEARWNRVGQTSVGTFTWMAGDKSGKFFRDKLLSLADSVQNELDADMVRSIDLAFDTTGAWRGTETAPRNGYLNISAVYADVLEHLVTTGVTAGVLGHFGNSGGSVMCANALANHRLDEVLDGVVFGGGPFWIDLTDNCLNASSPLFGNLSFRSLIDAWHWKEMTGGRPCEMQNANPDPGYECRSMLGVDANHVYPDLSVAVVVGALDSQMVTNSAQDYLQRITARTESFDNPPGVPHNVLLSKNAANLVLAHMRGIIAAGKR